MTAKEMFKELGYKLKNSNDEEIEYIEDIESRYKNTITFELIGKKYDCTSYFTSSIYITPKLHQAITQQLKELGWIE